MTQDTAKPRTIAEEMAAGRTNTPDFAWPTVWLFLGLFAVFFLSLWAAISGRISYTLGALINTGFIYGIYTIVHEAIHGNISLKKKLSDTRRCSHTPVYTPIGASGDSTRDVSRFSADSCPSQAYGASFT